MPTDAIHGGVALEGRHAIVTGAGAGIGRRIATDLAAAGARVTVADVDRAPRNVSSTTKEVISKESEDTQFVRVDVTDHEAVESAVIEAEEAFGPVDILVNNAGINRLGRLDQLDADDFDAVLDVNLRGVFSVTQAALPSLLETGGSVVNIASTAGINGAPEYAAYGPSKAAVLNLTRQLAVDFSPHGVRFNAVAPGVIDAGLAKPELEDPEREERKHEATLLDRLGTPQDVANAVLFLVSDAASFVTGETLIVDGGLNA